MELYEVLDIYLNAYLMSDNFECKKVEVINTEGRRKVAFYYLDDKNLRASVKDYRENDYLKKYISNYLATKRQITKALRGAKHE